MRILVPLQLLISSYRINHERLKLELNFTQILTRKLKKHVPDIFMLILLVGWIPINWSSSFGWFIFWLKYVLFFNSPLMSLHIWLLKSKPTGPVHLHVSHISLSIRTRAIFELVFLTVHNSIHVWIHHQRSHP